MTSRTTWSAAGPRAWLRRPLLARIGVVVLLLCVWEVAARWLIDPMFISPPSRVFMSLDALLETRGVPAALRVTFWELGIAFVLSVVIVAMAARVLYSTLRRIKFADVLAALKA